MAEVSEALEIEEPVVEPVLETPPASDLIPAIEVEVKEPEDPPTASEIISNLPEIAIKDALAEKISNAVLLNHMPEDAEFLLAKNYLSTKMGVIHPLSLYDHLTTLIMHSIESKSTNIVDNFETFSLKIKQGQFSIDPASTIEEVYIKNPENENALLRLERLKRVEGENGGDNESGDIPDMMDLAALWEWAGVSFGKEDTFLLFLSIKKLVEMKQLKSVRLWGKIYGRFKNYIITEGEMKEGADDPEDSIVNELPSKTDPITEVPQLDVNIPKISKPKVIKREDLTKEARINIVGGTWFRLPDVVPERLQESRKIHKYLTGDPSTKIHSYPAFKGNEGQYLRCQIARISASTVVSPKGYYMIDPDAEDAEESNEYEGIPNDQLVSTANWVHHVPYILPQGKVVWETPKEIKEGASEVKEGDDEEPEEEALPIEPETGPPVLSSLSVDEEHCNTMSWSTRLCSLLSPSKYSPVTLRSNRWPGALVLAYNDKFANIYIGDGLKDVQIFQATPLGNIEKEYEEVLIEQTDPTVEEELAFDEANKIKEEETGEEAEEPEEE